MEVVGTADIDASPRGERMGNSRINRAAGETEQVVDVITSLFFGHHPRRGNTHFASFSHLEFKGFLPGLLRWWWYSAVFTWCLTQRTLPGAAAAPHFMHFPSLARRSCHLRWRDTSKSVNSSTMRLTPSPPGSRYTRSSDSSNFSTVSLATIFVNADVGVGVGTITDNQLASARRKRSSILARLLYLTG
jgi:hypothetical protein